MPLVTRNTGAGNIYVDSTQPTDVTSGTLWVDTSTSPPSLYIADGSTYNASVSGSTNIAIGAVTLTLSQWLAV